MPDDLRALVGRFLDRKRWSQERTANECEMDHSLVSHIESGQRQPTRESIAKLCAGLGLDRGDADRLWLAAGCVPPDLDREMLREAIALARAATPGEIAAARRLLAVAREGAPA